MKNKTFLNKLSKLRPRSSLQIETERALLPRLKFMAFLLFGMSIATFLFALLAPREPELQTYYSPPLSEVISLEFDDTPLELDPHEVLNFYTIASLFASTSVLLLFLCWKKKKTLYRKIK